MITLLLSQILILPEFSLLLSLSLVARATVTTLGAACGSQRLSRLLAKLAVSLYLLKLLMLLHLVELPLWRLLVSLLVSQLPLELTAVAALITSAAVANLNRCS